MANNSVVEATEIVYWNGDFTSKDHYFVFKKSIYVFIPFEDWDGTYKDELEWSLTKMTLFNKNIGRHLEMERELNDLSDQVSGGW